MPRTKPTVTTEDDFSAYPSEGNPDPKTFSELILTNTTKNSHLLSSSGPDSHPLLAVTTSHPLTRGKPAVTLHSSPAPDSPPFGIVKFGYWRKQNIGFCTQPNPAGHVQDTAMEWMKLVRVSMRTIKEFEFEYEGKMYVWTTIKHGAFGERPDMELRERGEGERDLLAFYAGERRKEKMKTGSGCFFLKGKKWDGAGGVEWGRWELVVMLTGLGNVEYAKREATRRKTAASMG
jgi:hypothetical protein